MADISSLHDVVEIPFHSDQDTSCFSSAIRLLHPFLRNLLSFSALQHSFRSYFHTLSTAWTLFHFFGVPSLLGLSICSHRRLKTKRFKVVYLDIVEFKLPLLVSILPTRINSCAPLRDCNSRTKEQFIERLLSFSGFLRLATIK